MADDSKALSHENVWRWVQAGEMVSFESIQRVSFVCQVTSWIGLFIWISENLICMSCVVDRILAVCYFCRWPKISSEKQILSFVQKQELSQSIIMIGMNSGPDLSNLRSPNHQKLHNTQKCQPRWFHHNNPKLHIFWKLECICSCIRHSLKMPSEFKEH